MNVTGPNKEKADFASTAVMKTEVFNPPPKVHGNMSSIYYNCCMVSVILYSFRLLSLFSDKFSNCSLYLQINNNDFALS